MLNHIKKCLFLMLVLNLAIAGWAAGGAWAASYTGGSGDGYSKTLGANTDIVTITSAGQTFSTGDVDTAISTITVSLDVSDGSAGINTTDDIRVKIPSAIGMVWDTADTAATIGGTASAKVSTTVSYEDAGKTLVIDVTSDFVDGENITIGGLSFSSFTGRGGTANLELEVDNAGTSAATDDGAKQIDTTAFGGSGDGYSQRLGANADIVSITSAGQTFSTGDVDTAISTITVSLDVSDGSAGINTTDDIRVKIPSAIGMVWDTADTAATIGGTASAKVSTTVSYEDAGKTLVIDVTSDFVDGENITISGLSFSTFTGRGGTDNLELEVDNAGTIAATDDGAKQIDATALGGSGDGFDKGVFGGSNVYTWTGTADASTWADQGNWDIGDGSAGDDGYPDDNSDKALIDSTAHTIVTGGALTVGGIEITSGFSGTVTSQGVLDIDNEGEWSGDLIIEGGTFDANDQTLTIDGDTAFSATTFRTGTGAITFGNAASDVVTVSAGSFEVESDATDTDITINAGTWTSSGGTISFLGGSSSAVFSTIGNYYHLVINASGNTFTSTADIDINGNITLTAGTLDVATNNNNLTVAGNWTNNATFLAGDETVTFDGTTTLVTGGTGDAQDFYNLIIDGTVTINTNDVDVDGSLTLASGSLTERAGGVIAVAGDFLNTGGTYTANNGTLVIDGSGTTTISGSNSFYDFTSTTAGKTITFTDGTTQTVNNILTLTGAANNLITLGGTGTAGWAITDSGTEAVSYVSVSYATAANGITAGTSYDGGNNTNWTFTVNSVTWDGSTDTDWDTADNWDSGFVPNITDNVVITDAASEPVLTTAVTVNNLTINSDAVLFLNGRNITVNGTYANEGTLQLNGDEAMAALTNDADSGTTKFVKSSGSVTIQDLSPYYNLEFDSDPVGDGTATFVLPAAIDVNNNLIMTDGTLDVSGGDFQIIVGGSWQNPSDETLTARSGTVVFDDASKTNTVTGSTDFYNLAVTTAGKSVTLTAGTTQTVDNTLTLTGSSGSPVTLRSSIQGNKWDMTFPNGAQSVSYVDVEDSDANTNTVTCLNCTDENNNNVNWIFNYNYAITTPGSGKTVDTTPTVAGTGSVGATVQILDKDDNVVGSTVVDANGNYSVEIGALEAGANTLTPKVGVISGAGVNVTVKAAPTESEVPVIALPAAGAKGVVSKPTITGQGKPGETVNIMAYDENGDILLATVGSGVVDGSGNFSVTVTTDLPGGENNLFVTVDGVGSSVITVTFTDPFGVVFDASTNEPVEGAVVSIYRDSDDELAVVGVDLDPGDVNPVVTGSDGFYSFFTADNDYYITVDALGYAYPSAAGSFPGDRTIVNGSLGEVFTVAGTIIEMDHPVDSNGEQLIVTKDANKKDVVVGDIVTYTVTIENPHETDAPVVLLEDRIPAGFKYISGKTILDGAATTDPTGGRPLVFSLGTVSAGQTRILKYQLVVGSGVSPGTYDNTAWARYSGGRILSNTATEEVRVVLDPTFDMGTVIGKVFFKDSPQAGDNRPSLQGVNIVMADGTVITVDQNGKFSVPGIIPGRHVFRLDERTLPQGARLISKRTVIADIRPGMLHKVNFEIVFSGMDELSEDKTPDKISLTASDMKVERIFTKPVPRLHAAVWPEELIVNDGLLVEPARFYIFTNYGSFINKWTLTIRDADTGKTIHQIKGDREHLNYPLFWDGKDDNRTVIDPDKRYEYFLTVTGDLFKEDRTQVLPLRARRQVPKNQRVGADAETEEGNEIFNRWLSEQSVKNSLDKQTIRIYGETVKIKGLREGQTLRVLKGQELINKKTLSPASPIIADELVHGNWTENAGRSGDADSLEMIIPNGTYTFAVAAPNILSVADRESSFADFHEGQDDQDELGVDASRKTVSPAEVLSVEHQEITVGDDYLFFVGLGDAKLGYTVNTGNIDPVRSDDQFQDGFWSEGKAAYYLKGKVLGKYLITSSFDSERDQKEIFRNVDPDQYYPIYGDESGVDYTAGDTQGMLYVLIEWDRSEIKWGNFQTGLTETEFATFNRSLYGGSVNLMSVSDTKFGEPRRQLMVFQAKAQQINAHNEFTGTGGSLFYLKHKDIVQGSDQVRIEVRDQITGLVLSSETMTGGSDYELDEKAGRIQFRLPVSMLAESASIVSDKVLDGNPVYVVVDYAYEPKDKFDQGAAGGRVTQAIGERVQVGGTYVKESQSQQDYELQGVDVTVRPDEKSKVSLEYARSESQSTGNFISTDGGLSFTELAAGDDAAGAAWGISGVTRTIDRLMVTGYFKRIDADFSTDTIIAQQGKELFGFSAAYDITDSTRLSFRQDTQKLRDGGNEQTQLQVGAQETSTTAMQVIHNMRKLRLTGEWRHQESSENISGVDGEVNSSADILAVKADYQWNDKTTVSLKQQVTLDNEESHKTSVGIKRQVTDGLTVSAEQSAGSKGNATRVAASTDVSDAMSLSAELARSQSVEGNPQSTGALGANVKVDEDTSLTTSAGMAMTGKDRESVFTFGGVKQLTDDITWQTQRAISTSADEQVYDTTYEVARVSGGRRFTASLGERTAQGKDELARSNVYGLSGDINENWSAFMHYEKGGVQDLDLVQSERHAVSLGAGFVDQDKKSGRTKIRSLSKIEMRYDEGAEDQRQYNIRQIIEGRPNENLTLYAKADVSRTENLTAGTTDEEYNKIVTGMAYRPVQFDRLNLLGRYTYLKNVKPGGQVDSADIQSEKAHVFSSEAIYDINGQWRLSEKFALRLGEEKVAGFDWTESQTWLSAHGLGYRWDEVWRLYAEYRVFYQKQADDYKQGLHLELSREIGDYMDVGIGYDLTDFTDDLTDLDYTAHGVFFRVTGALDEDVLESVKGDYRQWQRDTEESRQKEMFNEWVNKLVEQKTKSIKEKMDQNKRLMEAAREKDDVALAEGYAERIVAEENRIYLEAFNEINRILAFEKGVRIDEDFADILLETGQLTEAKNIYQSLVNKLDTHFVDTNRNRQEKYSGYLYDIRKMFFTIEAKRERAQELIYARFTEEERRIHREKKLAELRKKAKTLHEVLFQQVNEFNLKIWND